MKQINRIIAKELTANISWLGLILFLILLGVGFEALAPWPFKVLLDNVLGQTAIDSATRIGKFLSFFSTREALGFFAIISYCLFSIMVTIAEYLSGLTTKKLNASIINNFSRRAFDSLLGLVPGYYHQQEIGDYIYRLGYDVAALGGLLENGLLPIVTNALYLITTVVVLFLINKVMTTISLVILPFLIFSLWLFNKRIGVAAEHSERSNSTLFSFIQEALSQLKIIQAFNRQKDGSKTFGFRQDAALTNELNVSSLNFLLDLLIGVIIAIGYAVVILYGINAVFVGKLSTGLLIVFIFYLDNLTSPMLTLMNAFANLREDYVMVSRLNDFFTKKFQTIDQGTRRNVANADIIFDHVTVRSDEGTPILNNISCVIPAGKKTVIVGTSGSGKTTMANLLLRFIEPTSGNVLIGTVPLQEIDLATLREAIAYVPQEIALFNDTIENNVTFGSKAAARDLKRAVQLAAADHFIDRLPGGLVFKAGEGGINLSGGQRQRIMLARAFFKQAAQIFIFDEPISALDVKTRKLVLDNIYQLTREKTTIIISNIMEMISHADYVIVLNEGKIIHAGKSNAVLAESHLTHLILRSH